MADISGTSGNDVINGTNEGDRIVAGAGNDTVNGGGGGDVIIGDGGDGTSAGGTGASGGTLGDGPGSTGGGYDRISAQSVYNGNHSFSTDAFYLGNDIPVLDDANRNAITGVSFSQDGEGTDRTFGLDELTFTGAQRSFVGLVTVQDSDISGANDQFSSSISGGFQDTTVVSTGTADFTMNDGQVFTGIRVNFVRGPDGETYMMPDDGPSPFAQNAFRAMLFNNSSGIDSFTIATGSGDDAGINPIEGNWADGQFAEITDPPIGDSFDDVLCGDEGDDIIYGDGGDSATAAGFGVAGGLLDPEERVDGTLYGRFPGSVYDGQFDFSSDAFYLGDDIGVLDGGNRNELRGQTFSQDGGGNTRVTELVDIDFTGAQKSFVGLATVQRTALHRANDQFSASNGDGFQDVVVVNDVDVTFTMNDGTVFQNIRMQFLRGDDGKTYLIADDHPQEGTFNSIRTTVYRNDSGIESFTIQSSSGNINGINPIVGNWAAGQFKITQDGEGGDDIIKGGAGSDTMFGEGGDDTFIVDSAADGAGDVVVGGNGPDQNTDTDVLDLRGAGVVTIDAVADDNDAGAQSGTVTFNNGETLTFEGIEEILQDDPALTIAPAPGTQTDPATGNPLTAENGTPAQIVITRNTPTDDALEVLLTNGDPSETDAPVSVIIPAGAAFVIVDIPSVDDPIVDGDQISTITATADGFEPVSQDVTVADDDTPALTIEPGPNTPTDPATGLPVTQENGDPVELVVTRNTPTDQPLTVTIQNGDPSELNPPIEVTIPAGEESVSFLVDPVDDPLVDGDQMAPITATAPGLAPATQAVLVEDDDLPALTIEPGPNTPTDPATGLPVTQENGDPVELVVTRNTPTDQPLTVTIQNGDPSELNPPIEVTIPAGEESVSFLVDPVDDPLVDGDQMAPITATAPGLAPATQAVLVEDDDLPALTIEPGPNTPTDPATGLPVTQENGDPVELVVTRNTPTDQPLTVTIQNGDPSELNPPIEVTIPAGEESVSFLVDPVDDPEVDGDQIPPITATAPGLAPATQAVLVEDDDLPALTIEPGPNTPTDPATGLPVTQENGDPVELVVTRNTPTDQPLTVTIQNGDPSELNPPIEVTIPAGEESVSFLVDPVDDPLVDGDQMAPITATAPGLAPATQAVLVEDDDLPALTIEPGPNTPTDPATGLPVTQENGDPVELVVTRNTPTDQPLTVTIQNGDPSELNPPIEVTIPAGEESVSFLVDPVDDPLVDGDQMAPITATAPGLAPATQAVLVEDDDLPALTIEPGPNTPTDPATGLPVTQENGDPVELVVTRNTPTDQPLTVTIQNGDPSELNPPIEVTIPAGEESVSFLVDPVDDPEVDGDQMAPITATAPGLAPATQAVLVEDDDLPALTIEPGPNTPTDPATGLPVTQENGDPVELVVTRNTPTDQPLTVTIQNGDPSELNPPIEVTIPAGEESVSFLVDPVDDPEVDGDQMAPITATAPGLAPATQAVLVEDDDEVTPTITVTTPGAALDAEGRPILTEGGDPVDFVVTRDGPLDQPLVLQVTSGDETEATVPQFVTLLPGQDTVTVPVTPVDDDLIDGDQFPVITVTPFGSDIAPVSVEAVVQDDDEVTPTITVTTPGAALDAEGRPILTEGGDPVDFVVTRDGPLDQPLVLQVTSGDETEATVPQFVTLLPGQDTVTVPVTPVDDDLIDGDQFPVITVTPFGSDIAPVSVEAVVQDDDEVTPTITVTTPGAALDAEGRPILTEGGDPVDFVVTRDGPLDDFLVLQVSSDDGTEATVPQYVFLAPGQTSVTVPVTPVDDDLIDGDQFPTITVTPLGSDFAPVSVEAVVQDNDGQQEFAPVAGDDNANTQIDTFVFIDVLENDVDPDGDDANLQITDVSIVSGGGFVQVVNNELLYIPETGFTGSVELSYEVTDEQGLTDTATVNLHVTPENVAPTAFSDLRILGTNDIKDGATVELGNVLQNDSDPDGDAFFFKALGTDDTVDADGFFGWADASDGGEIRVNQNGSFEFRDMDGDFAQLGDDELAITSIDYTIVDEFGAEDTATITVKVFGEEDDCGCGGGLPTPPDFFT